MNGVTGCLAALTCLGSTGPVDRLFAPGNPGLLTVGVAWFIPLAIVLLGGGLLAWHWQSWRAAREQNDEPGELAYQRRRFRRRMQTSGMLCLLGAAMAGGQAIPPRQHPSLFVFFWTGVALLALWAMALAVTDLLATRIHVGRLVRRQLAEQAKLQAELTRKTAEQGEGAMKRGGDKATGLQGDGPEAHR